VQDNVVQDFVLIQYQPYPIIPDFTCTCSNTYQYKIL